MPVVELNLNRIKKLVSSNVTKKKIIETLPFLGLDIESQDGDQIRIEYSPNRPDYSTDFGIALGLQGLLGIKKGIQKTNIRKQGKFEINVDSSLSKIRPFVTGIIAKNGTIDDITFLGSGCAISKASASIMTSVLKGMKVEDTKILFDNFHTLATTGKSSVDMGKLSVLAGVHKYPARVKCATLAWHTFHGALNNSTEIIKTE